MSTKGPHRFEEQRWLLDNVIRQFGVDWDQGRTRYFALPCPPDAETDFQLVRDRVRKFADIDREFAAAARRREQRADDARRDGHAVAEREHAFVASILWGAAEWPLFWPSAIGHAYNQRKVACYERFIALAPHPVRRIEIPFGSTTLPAYLHLPAESGGPWPIVIQVGGMDSFKEHLVSLYGDRFLERGIARLTFDGPGQGESFDRGLFVSATNFIDAGRAVVDWAAAQPEIDAARIALGGVSFGSFWATQIAGALPNLAACGVALVLHERAAYRAFSRASPTFKARFMAMAGIEDEAAFDAFAESLTLEGVGQQIRCPFLVVAGEEDDVSAIESTWDLLATIKAPRTFALYQGERHGVGTGTASALGPIRDEVIADWFADRLAGRPMESELRFVDTAGRLHRRPLDEPVTVAEILAGTAPRSAPIRD